MYAASGRDAVARDASGASVSHARADSSLLGMIAAIFPAVVAYKFDIAKVLKNKI